MFLSANSLCDGLGLQFPNVVPVSRNGTTNHLQLDSNALDLISS